MNDGPPPRRLSSLLASSRALRLVSAWKRCAGPALDTQALFLGIRDREGQLTLLLVVADAVWRQELEFQKKEILGVYNRELQSLGFAKYELPVAVELLAHEHALLKNKTVHPQKGRVK